MLKVNKIQLITQQKFVFEVISGEIFKQKYIQTYLNLYKSADRVNKLKIKY